MFTSLKRWAYWKKFEGLFMNKKTRRPDKSMKVNISRDKSFEYYNSIKSDIGILSWMEFKMRLIYNSGKYSLYRPTLKEIAVIKRNIEIVDESGISIDDFTGKMIIAVYDDIVNGKVPRAGYNKRAIVDIINVIKSCWLVKYPNFIWTM